MAKYDEIKLGTKYVNTKGKVGEVVEKNDKTKTITLKFEDGKSQAFTSTSIDRLWKEVADEATKEAESEPKATIDDKPLDEVAGDGTPLAEVGKEIAEQAKQKAEEHKKLNESAKKTSEIINKAEAKEAKKEAEKKADKKQKKASKPKKEDKQVIETAIKALDDAKATHKESWQNKGTAMYVGKIRVFECWKRLERMRINYNPELTSIDAKLCMEVIEDKRTNSHLSVTCYVQADKVAEAVKALVKNTDAKAVDAENAKKSEKKATKKEKKEATAEKAKSKKTKTEKEAKNPAKDS